jgi:hypothetical protein
MLLIFINTTYYGKHGKTENTDRNCGPVHLDTVVCSIVMLCGSSLEMMIK